MIAANSIFGHIIPEKIDRSSFVRVMQLRDFRRFAPQVVERVTLRAEQEFGRHSPNKPKFELPIWERWLHTYVQTHQSDQQSRIETNLTMMARIRFFQWMREYQSSTRRQKAALMNDVVEDVYYWQAVYLDYLHSLGFPEPTLAELYQDSERMIENFKVDATQEEIVLIDSFVMEMNRALVVTEVQKSIIDFLPLLRTTQENTLGY